MALSDLLDVAQQLGAGHTGSPAPVYTPAPGEGEFRGDWKPNTWYGQFDQVIQGGATVYALQEHTSHAAFNTDSAKWAPFPLSVGSGGGSFASVSSTSAATGTLADSVYEVVDATAGARTRTLPTGVTAGKQLAVEKTDSSSNAVTVTGKIRGSNGASVSLIDQYESIVLVSEGNDSWHPYAGHRTKASLDARFALLAENVNVVASAGAATTLPDVATASVHDLTLTAAACTLTFPTPAPGKSFTLNLRQDSTGGRTVTWPGNVTWPGSTAPTLTTTATRSDMLSFVALSSGGWRGFVSGQNFV